MLDTVYAEIILSINSKEIDRVFHYKVPRHIKNDIKIGMVVSVPFGKGNRLKQGYVIGFTNDIDIDKTLIKEIHSIKNNYTIFSENMIKIAKFISHKYYSTLSEAMQCIMPKIIKDKEEKYVYINDNIHDFEAIIQSLINKNNKQSEVLEILKREKYISLKNLKEIEGISISSINTLKKNDIIKIDTKKIKRDAFDISNYKKTQNLVLNTEQENALNFIKQKIDKKDVKPTLLHGVTGSGKTEIYLQLIQYILSMGKQAIVLVPEISLTPQTVERFIGRFGNMVSVTHSRLNNGERFDQWKKAKDNDIKIMVGARSAIFTPFDNIGIIIIDEEHEMTYKSESTPKYDTREVAKEICKLTGATLVLGSATPSIESYYNAKNGKYNIICMKKRVNNCMPNIEIVDMRAELAEGNTSIFSNTLHNAIQKNIDNNMQTILFLNRRGHSTFISCRACGEALQCVNCDINYTYHLSDRKLMCHYCGDSIPIPKICPKCGSKHIKYFGIGTQKVEEHIKKSFDGARVLRMDFDTTSKKGGHYHILEKFKNNEANILIGTQMIAKGLDFEKVSLVGVLAADIALNMGDYKSSEMCFQILTQVSGRAGRSKYKGQVFIQTYTPEHYSIQYAKNSDYIGFYETEIKKREDNFYPPFSNIFFIMIFGENEQLVKKAINMLHKILRYYNQKTNFYLSDISKTYIYKAKKQYRYKIFIKAKEEERLKNFVLYCVDILRKNMDTNSMYISLSLNPNYMP